MFTLILLQPRKFFFKNKQKKRSVLKWNLKSLLNYGDCGIKVDRPLRMSSRQIFRLKVSLKKAIRKPDHTKRYVWFNTFPHMPLTKKPKGMRMGKGIGKLNAWQSHLKGNSFIFEFKNLRTGRSIKFFKKVRVKLPVPTTILFKSNVRINYLFQKKANPRIKGFW